ncbi:MAG: NAD(P)/FAD-dependent oxidoreductase, partial [Defluviitaleaceae bacterium]|nr:NAD(P)/FAD-dependent oxidoreductase [Defluviitaleaceae bacterium]
MRVIVVGGGAAGMMAAASAAENGAQVILLEKNEKLGKKLFITGKGRCNITNETDVRGLLDNTLTNPRFLNSAFHAFDANALQNFAAFEGVPFKTERGGRVFPASDKADDINKSLEKYLRALNVKIFLHTNVKKIFFRENFFCVRANFCDFKNLNAMRTSVFESKITREEISCNIDSNITHKEESKFAREEISCNDNSKITREEESSILNSEFTRTENSCIINSNVPRKEKIHHEKTFEADAIIIATGGISYPSTGSTGDGYVFAKNFGHGVTEIFPSLASLITAEKWVSDLEGLSLR